MLAVLKCGGSPPQLHKRCRAAAAQRDMSSQNEPSQTISVAATLPRQVLVVSDGVIAEKGTHWELLNKGALLCCCRCRFWQMRIVRLATMT